MQKSNEMQRFLSETLPSATNLIYAGVAGFLALIGKWLVKTLYQMAVQKMPESTARAKKTEAEAQQITVKASIDAATAINQVITQMLDTQRALDALRAEVAIKDAEIEIYDVQNRALRALLDLHGIPYDFPSTKKE